jgi:TatD DNase family protein
MMRSMLFDTHVHLDDEQFAGQQEAVVTRARQAGVVGMVAVGTMAVSSQRCVALAQRYEEVFAAVGIQPNYAAEAAADDWDQVVALVRSPQVVALGETGLDRHWDFTPFPVQQDYFDRHLRLAQRCDLPVIIHMRECAADLLEMLREARGRGPLRGVLHAFTGNAATAAECLELGFTISFAGMVSYPKSTELRETARVIPPDRIVIETDAPYLSPHPHRGQRPNEPALIIHTAACLAELRGVDAHAFATQTTANARRLFGCDGKSSTGMGRR